MYKFTRRHGRNEEGAQGPQAALLDFKFMLDKIEFRKFQTVLNTLEIDQGISR